MHLVKVSVLGRGGDGRVALACPGNTHGLTSCETSFLLKAGGWGFQDTCVCVMWCINIRRGREKDQENVAESPGESGWSG